MVRASCSTSHGRSISALQESAGDRVVDEAETAAPAGAYDALGEAKRLLRSVRAGALATLAPPDGGPFTSLVNVATDVDGSPLLLLSRLAVHTRNLAADARCSLLLAQTGKGDPLAHPRLTVCGAASPTADERARARFLRRHPKSTLYAGFGDFGLWRMAVGSVHLNGGFGKAADFRGRAVLVDVASAAALLDVEAEALAHLNDDHADALGLCAQALAREAPGPWRASGLDPEGLDLLCGDRTARIAFPQRVGSPGALRETLKELAAAARRSAPAGGA
jgi:putative heme iron utilization protein